MEERFELRDLGKIAENTRQKLQSDFQQEDIRLSSGFKDAFSQYVSSTGNTVEYKSTTVIITNTSGQKIYAPNQWFVLAAYAVDLLQEIVKYRNCTEKLLDEYKDEFKKTNGSLCEKKDIYKSLKTDSPSIYEDIFKDKMKELLLKEGEDEELARANTALLYRFVSDDKWWYGGKGIERTNDFYVSPALGVLNLVNASQSYVATVAYAYVNVEALSKELPTMIDNGNNDFEEHNGEMLNEYARAAQIINDYILETGFEFLKSEDELNGLLAEFNAKFSPEKLMAYSDDELMTALFYTAEQTNDSMCYWLEFHKDCRAQFGSVAGGTSLKYGIYQNKNEEWITGSPSKKEIVPYEEAVEIGKSIRDKLVRGTEIIKAASLETVEDYEKLHDALITELGNFATNNWVHKYFYMIFPDKFTTWHSEDWQKHGLRALQIQPSSKTYGRSGQLALIGKYAGRMSPHIGEAFYAKFGGIKNFCRLGTSDNDGNYADGWRAKKIAAIGWQRLGNLNEYAERNDFSGSAIAKKVLADKLRETYYPNDSALATRKAGELLTFYNTTADTVFVMMDGERLLALADNVGEYFFDPENNMCHCKPAIWHCCFDDNEKLPKKAEGHMTSCFELKDDNNLLYLYKKYYYDLSEKEGKEEMAEAVEYKEPNYVTGIKETEERNRIVFGAPEPEKSWLLKQDAKNLLENTSGTLERVTFHPDYSYAQFVGTYKPVSDSKGDIRYEFVAGPFMRVFVDAILSGRSGEPQPHLLLIEEINRAKVAAVFGDVFQLLDRDENGTSEYEIQTSLDVRKYLAANLGGVPDNWAKIKLPDNMFIWATMNSADQGVFPMDTAFKRRWSFEYLGINENEKGVVGSFDIGGETIVWNRLRRAINDKLAKEYKVNEDKLMGPYFLAKKLLQVDENGMIVNQEKFIKAFKSKVIMYLYEDAAKQHKHKLFEGCDSSKYSSVCDAFDEIGISIFGENFKANYYD